jgi:hypothetical protein
MLEGSGLIFRKETLINGFYHYLYDKRRVYGERV